MALSGLGPALSGAYLNVQRMLLERKLQQEEIARRQQEAASAQQSQFETWMRQRQYEEQLRQQRAEAERAAQEPERNRAEAAATIEQLERLVRLGLIPQGVDISSLITRAAPGVAPFLPQRVGPFADVPGTAPGGMVSGPGGAQPIFPGPQPTFQGGPSPIMLRPPQSQAIPLVNVPGIGPMPATEAVKLIGTEGVRALQGITSPTEERVAEGAQAQAARQKALDFAVQLTKKMLAAVRDKDMARARRVAEQFDTLQGRYGIPDGVSAFRAAKTQVEDEELTRAGKRLQQARTRGGRRGDGGATKELERIRAAERAAEVRVSGLRKRVAAAQGLSAKAKAEEDLATAEGELEAWRTLRLEMERPKGMPSDLRVVPRSSSPFGLRTGTLGTEEQRPSSGGHVVASLPAASSVPVGTEAVDNRTGKRLRSDGKEWVSVP